MSSKNTLKTLAQLEKHSKTNFELKDVDTGDPKLLRAKLLMQREQANAKRSRLECLLVQQYIGKYGSKQSGSKINVSIKNFVHEYLEDYDCDKIGNATLTTLETKVRELAEDSKNEIITGRLEEKQQKAAEERLQLERKKLPEIQTKSRTQEEIDLNQWSVVNAVLALSDKEQRMAELRKQEESKLKFKKQLDDQCNIRERNKYTVIEEKQKELSAVKENLQSFNEEMLKVKQSKHHEILQERILQGKQIEDTKLRIQHEKEMRIAQEKRDMERAKRLQEEEQLRIQERKEFERINNERMKQENELNKILKAEAKKKNDEYDKKLNADYEAKLAKEELDRQNAFANRMNKLMTTAQKFATTTGMFILYMYICFFK